MSMLHKIDTKIISFAREISMPAARWALFIIFFWFGFLKLLGLSPASPLVQNLLHTTLPFISFGDFIFCFGLFEMVIGALFLIRGAERIVLPLLAIHMGTTFMPLVLLPAMTWEGFLVPTLEGQYIIKNLLIIGLALILIERLEPLSKKS